MNRGFWAIGVFHSRAEVNIGTLLRSAYCFGASFVFTVGRRYRRQSSDTTHTPRHLPLFHFSDIEDLVVHMPLNCPLVGIEIDERAHAMDNYVHPERACYLLGAEDHGLPPDTIERCHHILKIQHARFCLNVAVAGSIVMHDRAAKRSRIAVGASP